MDKESDYEIQFEQVLMDTANDNYEGRHSERRGGVKDYDAGTNYYD